MLIRDAEWLVRRVDRTSTGEQALSVVGLSELVKDKEAVFLTEIEPSIEVLDPVDTKLVTDTSSAYQASLLYMESLLRQAPPTDENLYVGHRAAMDPVPYQFDPAIQALQQPRQRILIADAVGLGKTLEAGILLSELIKRGKGKRILVVALKSMLTQFQKEMWSRFTIPLTRLDSVGIQRIRSRIPTNHNPFYYYDKAIISIDTLKQDAEYRTYIENAYWDVIVIDEAHNVAERGTSSLRSKLARLLARRSDTLIMLSATPHDGKARSFASLMNMLDPTAIANPDAYTKEDIKGLFIRRFKKDIQDQVAGAFKVRKIAVARCEASVLEEEAYDGLVDLSFTRLNQRRGGAQLFKTTLEKALFSSPAACQQTIRNRVRRLEKEGEEYAGDIQQLEHLDHLLKRVTPDHFGKYKKLLEVIQNPERGFGWTGKDKEDRLVIFTERIETLKYLREHLTRDLGLKDNQVEILHGSMPGGDIEQQRVVEEFGKDEAPVRLLIASDVASEGINLHYLSHRMIHFDIPWSLMVFQQRNGRIDRYGQEKTPQIVYLVTESANEKIKGDMHILELLIEKDDEAVKNIGDPSVWMGVYDIDEEEKITAKAIEQGMSAEAFEAQQEQAAFDPLEFLLGEVPQPTGEQAASQTDSMPSLFDDDFSYLQAALGHLRQGLPLQVDFYEVDQRIDLTAPEELKDRFHPSDRSRPALLPREMWPDEGLFILSQDRETIQKEIKRSRKDEHAWPRIQYLWELHPIVQWVNDKVVASFGRQEAPVLTLTGTLEPDEKIFILSGLIPNRKSHPLLYRWFGVRFKGNEVMDVENFTTVLHRTGLDKKSYPNRNDAFDAEALQRLLPEAVEWAETWMSEERETFNDRMQPELQAHLDNLQRLRGQQHEQLELRFEQRQAAKERERRAVDRLFDEYTTWITDTMETEDKPYMQVIAVLVGT